MDPKMADAMAHQTVEKVKDTLGLGEGQQGNQCEHYTRMGASEDMPMSSIEVMLFDMEGEEVGTATFTEGDDGEVAVTVMAEGIPSGEHGIHVHDVGICDPGGPERFAGWRRDSSLPQSAVRQGAGPG